MMFGNVPPEVMVSAIARGALFLIVFAVTVRMWDRKPTVGVIVMLTLGTIVLTILDLRGFAALVSMPNACLIAWVLVVHVRDDPQQLTDLLAAKEAAWSKQRHDLVNDFASEQARRLIAERRLQKLEQPQE